MDRTLLALGVILVSASLAAPSPVYATLIPRHEQNGGAQQPPVSAEDIKEIQALFNTANSAMQKHDYAGAERGFQVAFNRAEAAGDLYSMGAMLDALSSVYTEQGDLKKALTIKTRALTYLRQSGYKPGLARALMNTGILYSGAGQMNQAIAALQESVAIWEQVGDAPAGAAALGTLGVTYKKAGQFTHALATLRQSLQIEEAAHVAPRTIAGTHSDIGLVYYDMAQFDEARREYQIAMEIAQAANSAETYASALSNLGLVAMDRGRYAESLSAFNQTLEMREQEKDPRAIARALTNLGALAFNWGRYDAALFYSRRALTVAEQNGLKSMIADQHTNIGVSLGVLGQEQKAEASLKRALELYAEAGNPSGAVDAISNLGGIEYGKGNYGSALSLFSRILDIEQSRNNRTGVAQTLRMLAMTQDGLNKPEAALELFSQSNALYVKLNNPQALATSYNDLGVAYSHLNRPDDALAAFTKSLALKQRLGGNALSLASAQSNIAQIYGDKGDWEKSAQLLKEAVAGSESLRDQVAAPADIGALSNRGGVARDVYARYASALLHLNRPEDALLQVEQGRGQGLARQAAQTKTAWSGVLPGIDAKKMAQAAQVLHTADANLRSATKQAETVEENGDRESVRTARKEVDEATRVRDEAQQSLSALRNEFAARFPAFRALSGLDAPVMATYTELAKAHPDTLYLSWALGPQKETLLFALRADTGLKTFSLPIGQTSLEEMVRKWRAAVTPSDEGGPGADIVKEANMARALYETLFQAVEKDGLLSDNKTKRLVLIGDGALRELPFAALMGGADNKRLIERFPLSTGISLRLLDSVTETKEAASGVARPVGRGVLCVADPGGGAETQKSSEFLDGFAPLPAARQEGKAIGQLYGDGATVLIGSSATKDVVIEKMQSARLLHFATHGYLDENSGLKSGLLVALPKPAPEADDELAELPLLTGEEILQYPLSADLVTLSACETGRGQKSGGDGLLGLVWAFRAAGCPSIVASQWSVPDEATGQLMVKFYEGLKAGQRRDDALQAAMLSVRGDGKGRTAAPFYWAAFQLHGDATALSK